MQWPLYVLQRLVTLLRWVIFVIYRNIHYFFALCNYDNLSPDWFFLCTAQYFVNISMAITINICNCFTLSDIRSTYYSSKLIYFIFHYCYYILRVTLLLLRIIWPFWWISQYPFLSICSSVFQTSQLTKDWWAIFIQRMWNPLSLNMKGHAPWPLVLTISRPMWHGMKPP